MSHLTRRSLLAGVGSTAVAMFMAACSSSAPAPSAAAAQPTTAPSKPATTAPAAAAAPAKGKVKVVVWDGGGVNWQKNLTSNVPGTQASAKYYQWVVQNFTAKNQNAELVYENHGWDVPLVNNLTAAIAAGDPPEVTEGEAFVHVFVTLNAFAEIQTGQKFVPATILGAQENGKTYGICNGTSPFTLESNRTVIKKAGLDPNKPPTTWDELVANSVQIAKAGNKAYYGFNLYGPAPSRTYGTVLRTLPWINETGGYLGDDAGTTPSFSDPKAIPAYQLTEKLFATADPGNSFSGDEGKLYSFLWQNKAAYQLSAVWNIYNARSAHADTIYSPVPSMKEGGQSGNVVLGNTTFSPLKKANQVDLGVAYVVFLGQPDTQMQANLIQRIPTNIAVLKDPKLLKQPGYQGVTTEIKTFIDALLAQNVHPVPPWPKNGVKIWADWTTAFGQILKENASAAKIQQIMNGVQSQVKGLIT